MITKWTVANFKSIAKETTLDLAPLTIFAGANSSGKSAFLQTIPMISLTSPCHERKALIYGLPAVMHLLHSTRCPSRRLGKDFQQPQFTKNGVEVPGNAGDLDFQAFTVHLQSPQPDGL